MLYGFGEELKHKLVNAYNTRNRLKGAQNCIVLNLTHLRAQLLILNCTIIV